MYSFKEIIGFILIGLGVLTILALIFYWCWWLGAIITALGVLSIGESLLD